MITAIIPNWNGERFLSRLLQDLARQTTPPSRTLVIDNGSSDGSVALAEGAGATVIRLPENRGFAAAVNAGINAASTPLLAILNNDIQLEPDYLEKLSNALADDIHFATGKIFKVNPPNLLDATFDAIARSGCALRCGNGEPDGPAYQALRRIHSAPMTAALFRRSLFLEIGQLDERFESYLEDIDFGIRCAQAFKQGVFVPDALARHHGSATLGEWNPSTVRRISRNQVFLVAKHYPKGWPVLVGQLLWGLVAAKHGRGFSWLLGKVEGIQRFSEFGPQMNTDEHRSELRFCDEESIRQICGKSGYWRAYFKLT